MQNGQTVAQIARMREQLRKDRQTVLSVCVFDPDGAAHAAWMQEHVKDELDTILALLGHLQRQARLCGERIPSPSGFFANAQDRKSALTELSDFLGACEKNEQKMRAHLIALSSLQSTLQAEKHRLFRAVMEGELMLEAAREEEIDPKDSPLQTSTALVSTCFEDMSHLTDAVGAAYGLLYRFQSDTLCKWKRRLQERADLSNRGEQCDVQSVRTSLGELAYVCERAAKELSECF